MSLLIPLYVHPAEDPGAWHRLIAAAGRTHAVVLNPANGPGTAPDPVFAAAARALRAAAARLLGYVDTDYGVRVRDRARIGEDMRRHREWYAADGCFLDRVTADAGGLPACRRLVRDVRRLGAGTVVLNPGVHPAPDHLRLADLTVTFEGHWSTCVSAFSRPAWTARHPSERFCPLVHGMPEVLVPLAVRTAHERGAAISGPVTGEPPNPWAALTPALAGSQA